MENTTQTQAPQPGGAWKVMGILSIVFGGLSILFSFIPCLGMYAMYTGAAASVIAILALVMANSAKAPKTMAIIGLIISLASVGIGYWQAHVLGKVKDKVESLHLGDSLNKYSHQISDSIRKDMKDTAKK